MCFLEEIEEKQKGIKLSNKLFKKEKSGSKMNENTEAEQTVQFLRQKFPEITNAELVHFVDLGLDVILHVASLFPALRTAAAIISQAKKSVSILPLRSGGSEGKIVFSLASESSPREYFVYEIRARNAPVADLKAANSDWPRLNTDTKTSGIVFQGISKLTQRAREAGETNFNILVRPYSQRLTKLLNQRYEVLPPRITPHPKLERLAWDVYHIPVPQGFQYELPYTVPRTGYFLSLLQRCGKGELTETETKNKFDSMKQRAIHQIERKRSEKPISFATPTFGTPTRSPSAQRETQRETVSYLQSRITERPRIQQVQTQVIQACTGSWTASPNIIQHNLLGGFTITWPDTKETIQVPASQVPAHIQAVAAPAPPAPSVPRRFCGKLFDMRDHQQKEDRCPSCAENAKRTIKPFLHLCYCNQSF